MSALPLESLSIEQMESGHLCLNLSEKITWEKFPSYANIIIKKINANIFDKAETVDTRLWDIIINKIKLSLVFDDYTSMISIESSDQEGDIMIHDLYNLLMQEK